MTLTKTNAHNAQWICHNHNDVPQRGIVKAHPTRMKWIQIILLLMCVLKWELCDFWLLFKIVICTVSLKLEEKKRYVLC